MLQALKTTIHAAIFSKASHTIFRQHFLNFLPLPHGHGSFLPTFVFPELWPFDLGEGVFFL
ncbi:hypothetical protein Ngar_c19610 [Candidatus Nitrososphaera gargensis Ga9.2]|uniref:Uncharacterized protein n=1 Tax=Nitrososphaera gargensis (strain Ga9.2) TaxID=1237085 RepID=K0IIK7_NITGG|nr:hypothetical protein Ngar_c19610 [Candidatus Nitrososphaera gargensis Ga9.2]